jgi:hypothetical protein
MDVIKAAQDGDFDALSAVVADMAPRIEGIAGRMSYRRSYGFVQHRDEFRQVAHIALWEKLGSFDGDTVDAFYASVYRHMQARVMDAFRSADGGVPPEDISAFAKAVERADGDLHLAVKLAQIHPYSSRGRLSPDAARAASLAWQGTLSADHPQTFAEAPTVITDDVPDVSAPAPNTNKIKAAYASLSRHIIAPADETLEEVLGARELLSRGIVTETILDVISECITLPKDRRERLFIRGAFGILAAAVRSADHSATPADEYDDQSDEHPEHRAHVARAQTVRAILEAMSTAQSTVLRHTFGVMGSTFYGHGDSGDDAGMSQETGIPASKIPDTRKKGKASFVKRWIKAVALSEKHAKELEQAAAQQRKRGGRK